MTGGFLFMHEKSEKKGSWILFVDYFSGVQKMSRSGKFSFSNETFNFSFLFFLCEKLKQYSLKNFCFVFSTTKQIVTHFTKHFSFVLVFRRTEDVDTGEKTKIKIFSCENFPPLGFRGFWRLGSRWTSCERCNTVFLWSSWNVLWTTTPHLTLRRREGEQSFWLAVGENVLLQWSGSCAHSNKTIRQMLLLIFFHFFNRLANSPAVFHVQL